MASTSSYRKPPAPSRSVSLPQAPSNRPPNGVPSDTTYAMENEYAGKPAAQHNNASRSAQLRPHARSASQHYADDSARSFSARAKNTPQMMQDFDALNQGSPLTETHRPANPTPSAKQPSSYDNSPLFPQSSPHRAHTSTARAGFDSPSHDNEQVSPAGRSNTTSSPKDGRPQRSGTKTRSPLATLKGTLQYLSKEEKRAKVEEAEMLLRERQAGQQKQPLVPTARTTGEAASRDNGLGINVAKRPQRSDTKSSEIPQERRSSSQGMAEGQRRPSGGHDTVHSSRRESHQLPERAGKGEPAVGPEQFAKRQETLSKLEAGPDFGDVPDDQQVTSRGPDSTSFQQQALYDHEHAPRKTSQSKGGKVDAAAVGRSNSQKLQKRTPREPTTEPAVGNYDQRTHTRSVSYHVEPRHGSTDVHAQKKTLQHQTEDDRTDVRNEHPIGLGVSHARGESLSPAPESPSHRENAKGKQKQATVSFDVPPPTPPLLSEWKQGEVCKLRAADFDLRDSHLDKAWWETGGSRKRRQSQRIDREDIMPRQKLGENVPFDPALFLTCGPLLRFTGIKRKEVDGPHGTLEQDVWTGSIMIVTKDSASSYEPAPVIRLFSQPMSLLPPPPSRVEAENGELAPEYVDPIAGVARMGRNGKLLYVKPVDHIEEELDLSFVEGDEGLFEATPSPLDYNNSNQVNQAPGARIHRQDGESVGKYKEIQGVRLHADPARDVTFWRFKIEIELGQSQQRIAYRINHGSAIGFWVPAKDQSMNMMFYSGNGFGVSVDTDKYSGPDPMWRDVLNNHQTMPFHVMIGGGGQISSESVSFDTTHYQHWLDLKTKYEQYQHALNLDIKAELETFFLEHYSSWFSQGLFGMANSQIPMVNMWDGRDITAGFGSYSEEFMSSPVFSGLGSIAFKYYLLFQHQTVPEETPADEPSWLLGMEPSPYIHHKSRSLFMNLGKRVSLLAVDCRTERTREYIVGDDTYDHIWDRCYREIQKGEVKHLLILLAEPIASPRLAWIQNVLSSRAMDPVRALGRRGLLGGMGDNFEEGPGNPDDQWTAKIHKEERRWLVEDLQELAAEKSVRITILGGGDTLAAVGQFYSSPKLQVSKHEDYRYMPNIISSGIVDAPVAEIMSGTLNRRSKSHMFDLNTIEDMRAIFTHDVDGKPKGNKRIMPRRNWCSIREYLPGTTPAQTPSEASIEEPPPPTRRGSLVRSLSMSHGDSLPGKLVRRSSQRGPPLSRWPSLRGGSQRRTSFDGVMRSNTENNIARPRPSTGQGAPDKEGEHDPSSPRPGNFVRRRTDLSSKELKSAAKGGPDLHHFINLKNGLDVTLNCEVNPRDPAGITTPYRILVPALWFDGEFEPSVARSKNQWWKFGMKRSDHHIPGDHSPASPQSIEDEEDVDDQGRFTDRREKASNGFPRFFRKGDGGSNDSVPGGGNAGIDTFQPRKKFLGIF